MNNENEEEKNTVIERREWVVAKYCCDRMEAFLNPDSFSLLNLVIDRHGLVRYKIKGITQHTPINYCPNCGAKVVTEK